MKKIITFLLLFFIPILVLAKESISIESITVEYSSRKGIEKTKVSTSGLNANFDLNFENVNDYITYKIIINNPTNTDYELGEKTAFNKSDYIEYKYTYQNNSKTIKKKDKTTIFLTIKYINQYPLDEMSNGTFNETNKMIINLGNNIENPATKDGILTIAIVLVLEALLIIVFRKKKTYITILIIAILPIIVLAAKKLEINLNVKVTIEDNRVFYVYHSSDCTIDTINYYQNKNGYNLVNTVKDGHLYGGYFSDYHQKGSYAGDGKYVEDGIPFTGRENVRELRYLPFKREEAYEGKDNNGFALKPVAGTTYYMKEIPKEFYSIVSTFALYTTTNNRIDEIYIMSPSVTMNYHVGYIINNEAVIGETYTSYSVGNSNGVTHYYPYEMWGIENSSMDYYKINEINPPLTMEIYPFYVTQDRVFVKSKHGKKVIVPTIYNTDITTSELELDDYTVELWNGE